MTIFSKYYRIFTIPPPRLDKNKSELKTAFATAFLEIQPVEALEHLALNELLAHPSIASAISSFFSEQLPLETPSATLRYFGNFLFQSGILMEPWDEKSTKPLTDGASVLWKQWFETKLLYEESKVQFEHFQTQFLNSSRFSVPMGFQHLGVLNGQRFGELLLIRHHNSPPTNFALIATQTRRDLQTEREWIYAFEQAAFLFCEEGLALRTRIEQLGHRLPLEQGAFACSQFLNEQALRLLSLQLPSMLIPESIKERARLLAQIQDHPNLVLRPLFKDHSLADDYKRVLQLQHPSLVWTAGNSTLLLAIVEQRLSFWEPLIPLPEGTPGRVRKVLELESQCAQALAWNDWLSDPAIHPLLESWQIAFDASTAKKLALGQIDLSTKIQETLDLYKYPVILSQNDSTFEKAQLLSKLLRIHQNVSEQLILAPHKLRSLLGMADFSIWQGAFLATDNPLHSRKTLFSSIDSPEFLRRAIGAQVAIENSSDFKGDVEQFLDRSNLILESRALRNGVHQFQDGASNQLLWEVWILLQRKDVQALALKRSEMIWMVGCLGLKQDELPLSPLEAAIVAFELKKIAFDGINYRQALDALGLSPYKLLHRHLVQEYKLLQDNESGDALSISELCLKVFCLNHTRAIDSILGCFSPRTRAIILSPTEIFNWIITHQSNLSHLSRLSFINERITRLPIFLTFCNQLQKLKMDGFSWVRPFEGIQLPETLVEIHTVPGHENLIPKSIFWTLRQKKRLAVRQSLALEWRRLVPNHPLPVEDPLAVEELIESINLIRAVKSLFNSPLEEPSSEEPFHQKVLRQSAKALEKLRSGALMGLKTLNLSGLHLTRIPAAIKFLLADVEELNLSNNHLHDLSFSVETAPHLRVLNLSENSLASIGEILKLQTLEHLNVLQNPGLEPLPGIYQISSLRELRGPYEFLEESTHPDDPIPCKIAIYTIHGNRSKRLESFLDPFLEARSLNVSIEDVPATRTAQDDLIEDVHLIKVFQRIWGEEALPKTGKISTQRYAAILRLWRFLQPIEMQEMEFLDLSGLNLTRLPYELRSIKNLRRLNLANNQLRFASLKRIKSIENLNSLNLSGNNIEILQGRNLKKHRIAFLNLSKNHIHRISGKFLKTLGHCRHLDLSHNYLSIWPKNPKRFTLGLKSLFLHGNPLPSATINPFPASLKHLSVNQGIDFSAVAKNYSFLHAWLENGSNSDANILVNTSFQYHYYLNGISVFQKLFGEIPSPHIFSSSYFRVLKNIPKLVIEKQKNSLSKIFNKAVSGPSKFGLNDSAPYEAYLLAAPLSKRIQLFSTKDLHLTGSMPFLSKILFGDLLQMTHSRCIKQLSKLWNLLDEVPFRSPSEQWEPSWRASSVAIDFLNRPKPDDHLSRWLRWWLQDDAGNLTNFLYAVPFHIQNHLLLSLEDTRALLTSLSEDKFFNLRNLPREFAQALVRSSANPEVEQLLQNALPSAGTLRASAALPLWFFGFLMSSEDRKILLHALCDRAHSWSPHETAQILAILLRWSEEERALAAEPHSFSEILEHSGFTENQKDLFKPNGLNNVNPLLASSPTKRSVVISNRFAESLNRLALLDYLSVMQWMIEASDGGSLNPRPKPYPGIHRMLWDHDHLNAFRRGKCWVITYLRVCPDQPLFVIDLEEHVAKNETTNRLHIQDEVRGAFEFQILDALAKIDSTTWLSWHPSPELRVQCAQAGKTLIKPLGKFTIPILLSPLFISQLNQASNQVRKIIYKYISLLSSKNSTSKIDGCFDYQKEMNLTKIFDIGEKTNYGCFEHPSLIFSKEKNLNGDLVLILAINARGMVVQLKRLHEELKRQRDYQVWNPVTRSIYPPAP